MIVRETSCLPPILSKTHRFLVEERRECLFDRLDSAHRGMENDAENCKKKWIFRWQEQHGLKDKHRSGWISKIIPKIADYLDKQLEEDDELSSVEL